MTYTYRRTWPPAPHGEDRWVVGRYRPDGSWETEGDRRGYPAGEAARRATWLNENPRPVPKMAA